MHWADQVLLSTEGYICGISTFLSPPRIFVQYCVSYCTVFAANSRPDVRKPGLIRAVNVVLLRSRSYLQDYHFPHRHYF